MKTTISTVKSIASRNVWSSDWSAPFCKAILFYKKSNHLTPYNHTHPEWRKNKTKIFKELNLSDTSPNYSTPIKITLIKFTEKGFHQAMQRKAVYIPVGEGTFVTLGCKYNPIYILGEIDKVNSTPSWKKDFWDKKKIWTQVLEEGEYASVGNLQSSLIYPETGLMFLEVLYEN